MLFLNKENNKNHKLSKLSKLESDPKLHLPTCNLKIMRVYLSKLFASLKYNENEKFRN